MPSSIGTSLLDEPALANDVVRLLGAENQRLKREIHEAQQRATEAEARALVKQEPGGSTQDLAAAERVQQLLEENTTLRTQYQEIELKYETEKEKRRGLKAQIKELKSVGARGGIEESPEYLKLQKHQVQTQSYLDQADAYVKELLRQVEQMTRDKEAQKKLLNEARSSIALLSRNDPWSYITELHSQQRNLGFTRLSPFQVDREGTRHALNTFLNDTLKLQGLGSNPLIYRKHDITWSQLRPGFGFAVAPPYRYVPNSSRTSHDWESNNIQAINGPFELLYETRGFWYYCGTFTTSIIESRNNGRFFRMLRPWFKARLMGETIKDSDLLPPIVGKTIRELYSQGVLHVVCLVFERIGFNEQLNNALLEFGKDVRGPIFALDLIDPDVKRRLEEEEAAMPPKVKKARVVPAEAGPSKPSNSASA